MAQIPSSATVQSAALLLRLGREGYASRRRGTCKGSRGSSRSADTNYNDRARRFSKTAARFRTRLHVQPLKHQHVPSHHFFLTSRTSPARNEKEKRNTPVRRPSTPTLPTRPKADREQGRDHQERHECQHSLYSSRKRGVPPSLRTVREDQGIHSRVSRICTHQPGWDLWLF